MSRLPKKILPPSCRRSRSRRRPPVDDLVAAGALLETFSRLSDDDSPLLIFGDRNVPGIDWDLLRATPTSSRAASSVVDFCLVFVIWQYVRQLTRFRAGQNLSIRDLVFSRYEDEVDNVRAEAPLGRGDHAVLLFQYGRAPAPCGPPARRKLTRTTY